MSRNLSGFCFDLEVEQNEEYCERWAVEIVTVWLRRGQSSCLIQHFPFYYWLVLVCIGIYAANAYMTDKRIRIHNLDGWMDGCDNGIHVCMRSISLYTYEWLLACVYFLATNRCDYFRFSQFGILRDSLLSFELTVPSSSFIRHFQRFMQLSFVYIFKLAV